MAQTPPGHLKRFELIAYADDQELARSVAGRWLDSLVQASGTNSPRSVALSGGRITRQFFVEAANKAKTRKVSFDGVNFFWADERCVSPADPESNFALAREILFDPLDISESKIHRLRGELAPAAAASEANDVIKRILPLNAAGQPVLDLVFLGMGEDGHVASLFPNASIEVRQNNSPFLFISDSPKPPPNRVTLSYAALAAAKDVWVIAAGVGKEKAFHESLSENGTTPLARVLQSRVQTKIFTTIKT